MRDRFSDLIKKGVASFQEKPVGAGVPTLDPMVKAYNNLWGLLTDTHMSKVDDGYIITGTFVKSQYWEGFKYCCYYGNTNIKLGSGYASLENMVYVNGYQMSPDIYNGDYVIKLTPRPEPATADDAKGSLCPCGTNVDPCCFSLGESQIPHPFKEFFTPEQSNTIIEAFETSDGDAMKVVENLNTMKGHNFRISADNQYMVVDEKLGIKLN
jgi:hypothetical protein